MHHLERLTIAVLGGAGPQGRALAHRSALAGLDVVLGSRVEEKAEHVAAELMEATGTAVAGAGIADAAAADDVVLVVAPWDGHAELPRELGEIAAGVGRPVRERTTTYGSPTRPFANTVS